MSFINKVHGFNAKKPVSRRYQVIFTVWDHESVKIEKRGRRSLTVSQRGVIIKRRDANREGGVGMERWDGRDAVEVDVRKEGTGDFSIQKYS